MERVLVIACGGMKVSTAAPVPAIDLYAGRQFAIARQMMQQGWTVLILSAEHGLVPAHEPIVTYDRTMTSERAAQLSADRFQAERLWLWAHAAASVVFYGGALYARVFDALVERLGLACVAAGREITNIIGAGCGDHFSVLKAIAAE